jgi:hypothetical protein
MQQDVREMRKSYLKLTGGLAWTTLVGDDRIDPISGEV